MPPLLCALKQKTVAVLLQGHRNVTRVRTIPSPKLIGIFWIVSIGVAAAAVPFWDVWSVSGTAFHPISDTVVRGVRARSRVCCVQHVAPRVNGELF